MNSGAVAFDLALNTLCEPCSTIISKFEAIANQLNSLQLDECAAGKQIVATLSEQDITPEALGNALKKLIVNNRQDPNENIMK